MNTTLQKLKRSGIPEVSSLQVDEVPESLATGSYGRCRECGDRIEQGLLAADPATSLCYQCQTGLEIDHHWLLTTKTG